MKRFILIVMLLVMVVSSMSATSLNYTYTPYEEGEFPDWSLDLRRAETLFFGSYVLTIPLSAGLVSLANGTNMMSLDKREQALMTIGVATGVSLFIAGLDWALGRFE